MNSQQLSFFSIYVVYYSQWLYQNLLSGSRNYVYAAIKGNLAVVAWNALMQLKKSLDVMWWLLTIYLWVAKQTFFKYVCLLGL